MNNTMIDVSEDDFIAYYNFELFKVKYKEVYMYLSHYKILVYDDIALAFDSVGLLCVIKNSKHKLLAIREDMYKQLTTTSKYIIEED